MNRKKKFDEIFQSGDQQDSFNQDQFDTGKGWEIFHSKSLISFLS